MRLHRLDLVAFGPFRDAQEVDFDALSAAGIFLLTGDTGAGKSAVLDAVAYALYGRVPGDKGTDFRIRNTRATPTTRTQVALDFTARERRLRVTRTPDYERPKKRGAGTTIERGSVLLEEYARGSWSPVSTRADEIGHEIALLLGMTSEQFCQVVLLPQGRFATFLDAKPEDRRGILERLFGAERFAAIERWLADTARARRAALDTARGELATTLGALGQLHPDGGAPDADAPDLKLRAWGAELHELLAERLTAAKQRAAAAAVETTARASALAAARALATRQIELQTLRGRAAALAAAEPDVTAMQAEIAAATRAAPVLERLTAADDAIEEAGRADAAAADALKAALAFPEPDRPAGTRPGDLDKAMRAARDALARVSDLADVETEVAGLAATIAKRAAEIDSAEKQRSGLREAAGARPAARAKLTAEIDDLRRLVNSRAALETAAQQAAGRVHAARRRDELTAAVKASAEALAAARMTALDARERWLHVYERRLAGIAGELAERLTDGEPCPVCGSTEHPQPSAITDRVSETEEHDARADSDAAATAQESAHAEYARVQAALATATAEAGGSTPIAELTAASDAAADAAAAAGRAGSALSTCTAALAELESAAAADTERLGALDIEIATLTVGQTADTKRHAELSTRLTEHLGGADSVAERAATLGELAAACEVAVNALRVAADARERATSAGRAADAAAKRRGFADAAEAATAVRDDNALEDLRARVRSHEAERAIVEEAVGRPDYADLPADAPPVGELEAAHAAATAEHDTAERDLGWLQTAGARAGAQLDVLHGQLDALGPLRETYATADALARLATGTAQDNRLRMRLSSYVLSARLEQVAAAASARLLDMTDGRYSVTHTDERGRSVQQSGLGLAIHDAWDATDRPPAALSGGERFLASLALALGLSDVVTAEAGGTPMETLFVDEGFGSLDAETLDAVIDVLDGLRTGGRAVGIVSHVPELRTRIHAQLAVSKARAGSSLALSA